MNEIQINRIIREEEIKQLLYSCAPYFSNPEHNNKSTIFALSHKYAKYGSILKVVDCDDNPVGICAYYANDFMGFHAYLSVIIVIPSYQGKGIGKRLLTEAINDCKRKGMKKISLEVMDDNERAIYLYKSLGFSFCEKKTKATSIYSLSLNDEKMNA